MKLLNLRGGKVKSTETFLLSAKLYCIVNRWWMKMACYKRRKKIEKTKRSSSSWSHCHPSSCSPCCVQLVSIQDSITFFEVKPSRISQSVQFSDHSGIQTV